MSKKPRTPVYFPKMRVRGRRNRAKLAARYTRREILHVVIDRTAADGSIEFHAAPPGAATHVLAVDHDPRDGYGRPAPRPAPVKPSAPAPTARAHRGVDFAASEFKMTAEFRCTTPAVAPGLIDLLMGRRPTRNAT